MRKIVGLSGLAGAGKDTVASFLVERGWQRTAFADALYREVTEAYGVTLDLLQCRATKETPLAEMALVNCQDPVFVRVALEHLAREQSDVDHTLEDSLVEPRSPRRILQLWGTEYRRVIYVDSYWRDIVAAEILANPEVNFAITDVRFPDEARMIADMGGEVARVLRPEQQTTTSGAGAQHASERAMNDYPFEYTLINREGPQGKSELCHQAIELFVDAPLEKAA